MKGLGSDFYLRMAGTRRQPVILEQNKSFIPAHTIPHRSATFACSFFVAQEAVFAAWLMAGSARALQPLAHLIEGDAIDLAACIAPAQNLQRVWLKRFVKRRGDRPASASPAEPAARAPTEERHDPYPKQWQQGPESKSPVHVNPLFHLFHMVLSFVDLTNPLSEFVA